MLERERESEQVSELKILWICLVESKLHSYLHRGPKKSSLHYNQSISTNQKAHPTTTTNRKRVSCVQLFRLFVVLFCIPFHIDRQMNPTQSSLHRENSHLYCYCCCVVLCYEGNEFPPSLQNNKDVEHDSSSRLHTFIYISSTILVLITILHTSHIKCYFY